MRNFLIFPLSCCLLAGCGSDAPEPASPPEANEATISAADPAAEPAPGPTAEPSVAPPPVPAEDEDIAHYTSLKGCRVIRANAEEGGWSESQCPGLGGYRLELSESDLRQNLDVRPPSGGEHNLKVSQVTGSGGFSRMGETVEWRGAGEGASFKPSALIVRYLVVEDPDRPSIETGYLLAVSLSGSRVCVTAKVPPGPGQNERARELADRGGRCLPGA